MDERQLVEQITREVLKRLVAAGLTTASTVPAKPAILPLVLLVGDYTSSAHGSSVLTFLEQSQENFRIFTDNPESLPTVLRTRCVDVAKESEMAGLLAESSLLYLPWLPLAVLSRTVHLEPVCPVSLLLTKAFLLGKSVKAQKIFLEPELDLYQEIKPTPIIRRVQGLISEGRQMGIEWLADGGFIKVFAAPTARKEFTAPGGRKILTAEDVQRLKNQGVIAVARGTIITPLAREEIKRYGLRLSMD